MSSEDVRVVKMSMLDLIELDWGPRCETKDTDDFPELKGDEKSRCGVCVVYERFDKFWELYDEKG
jgi:hypothetical protein